MSVESEGGRSANICFSSYGAAPSVRLLNAANILALSLCQVASENTCVHTKSDNRNKCTFFSPRAFIQAFSDSILSIESCCPEPNVTMIELITPASDPYIKPIINVPKTPTVCSAVVHANFSVKIVYIESMSDATANRKQAHPILSCLKQNMKQAA